VVIVYINQFQNKVKLYH